MNDELRHFIDQGWSDHAEDAAGVALRLPLALDQVSDEEGLLEAARLAHHVWGEHLGNWADALKFMAALARGPGFDAQGESGRLLQEFRVGLALAGGNGDARATLDTSARVAVTARAAMLLAGHDVARSAALFDEALAAHEAAALPDTDPATRALAVAGNNASGSLLDCADRSAEQTALMTRAAEVGRRFWGRAGTWLQAERAEWQLARVWLGAGDAARARHHAQECLRIIDAQAEPQPVERFYGCELLLKAARAQGDAAAAAQALAGAQAAFDALGADDQAACRATLQSMQALNAGAA